MADNNFWPFSATSSMGAISQPTERNLQITAGFRSGSSISFVAEPVTSINLLGFQNQAIHNPSLVDCANAIGTSSTCTRISSVIRESGIRTFGSGYQIFRLWVPKLSGLGTGRKCVVHQPDSTRQVESISLVLLSIG